MDDWLIELEATLRTGSTYRGYYFPIFFRNKRSSYLFSFHEVGHVCSETGMLVYRVVLLDKETQRPRNERFSIRVEADAIFNRSLSISINPKMIDT